MRYGTPLPRRLLLVTVSLGLAILVRPAAAQAPAAAARLVREVLVRHADGEQPADADYVLAHTSLRAGAYFSQADLSRDQRALLDAGRFADVRILVEPVDDGVRVVYVVARRPRLLPPVGLLGNDAVRSGKVLDWLDFRDGEYLDESVVATHCAKARDEYRARYYPDARVEGRIVPAGSNGLARVEVTVHEGEKLRVRGFSFAGNRVLDDGTLRETLGLPGPWNPLRVFRKKRFSAQEQEDARTAVRDAYLDRGYLDVRVAEPRLVPADPHGQYVRLEVDEGRLYRVASIELSGLTLFPHAEMEHVVAGRLRPGDPAGRGAIGAAARALRDAYGSRGYVDTSVAPRLDASAGDGTVRVTFEIREGVLARVRQISIRGNTRTRDKVIRREIGLAPGEILDEVQSARSQRRLENLNYFESVRFFETPVPGDPALRDVVYEVKEKGTGQFMIGAGFSSVDNVIGFAEITQANFDVANWPYFHGGGQKARASVEVGSTRKTVDVSLVEPWFLDRRLILSLEGYRRELNYSEFDERRIGGGPGLTFPLPVGRVNVRYTFERVDLDDVLTGEFVRTDDPSRTYRFTDEDASYRNTPLRLSWLYDTRDRAFVPTRGMQATLYGELSGTLLGGDNEVYGVGLQARQWLPLWAGHVLSLRVRAETVEAYGDQLDVPIGDRLFLGGGRTVRGFDYRDIGPKVIPAAGAAGRYRPVGGRTLAMASAEYTVPVAKVLRFAAFYDIGNVWEESFETGLENLASSAGVGIRFDIPGFPIRLDYAVPITSDDTYTDEQRWVIWIGFE